MTPAARIASAIELLTAITGAPDRPADGVANDFFRARRFIGGGDRRAVSDRVWTVLRAHRRIAWSLDGTRTPRLLIAASLMLEGQRLSDVVELFSGGRFAPAPLSDGERNRLRQLQGRSLEHPAMPEAVRWEIPDWLMPRLAERYGVSRATELAALLQPAPLDLRANLLKATRDAARAALAAEGIDATPTPLSPWGLRIETRKPITSGAAFRAGLVEIQDEGSQLVALLTGARPGMRVADFCAGAGGKTLALAMTMENRGQVVACDVSETRLEGAVRRLRRAGVHNVERHLIVPGDKWVKRRAGSFDRVLLDAPCTGTGTWRRNPDARLRLSESDLTELLVKQREILDQAAPLVRTGGRLVYATCSLLKDENEAQVSAFLSRHAGFAVVPLARAFGTGIDPAVLSDGGEWLSLTPARHNTDGFFAAVLERTTGSSPVAGSAGRADAQNHT